MGGERRDRGAEVVAGRLLLSAALAAAGFAADEFVFQFFGPPRFVVGRAARAGLLGIGF
ncbi:hypothetical protein [Frigoriglobus tundricola]|uniref:hypothetical protein n=1 Tax=Frigoriglobus tundricola TaxID=2774151 RepID=UPI00148EC0A4|nr:hypothetical protein [Frigoriglobus tundricola]